MTTDQAIQLAQDWIEVRKEVRKLLIERARELYPDDETFGPTESRTDRFVFKLWGFPSDLSEERILTMIKDRTEPNETELIAKIRPHITIDLSGNDNDTITVHCSGGTVTVPFSISLLDGVNDGTVTLPDGTVFDSDTLQYAFQEELIAKTGRCVLEHDYIRAGFPELAKLARQARGAAPIELTPPTTTPPADAEKPK